MPESFTILDSLIILLYLAIVILISFYNSKKKDPTAESYFLARRDLGWFAIGISLFATNISSEHFIGLAGSGASRGLVVGHFELFAIFFLIILGWFLAPIYRNSNLFTFPEFIGKLFDQRTRRLFGSLSIFTYLVTKILVTLFASGILFNKIFGWSIFVSAVVIVLITGIYTLVGGFDTVIRTQIFQGILLLLGGGLTVYFGLSEVGGISALKAKLPADFFVMFKDISDPDFPWTGIIFGAPIIAFWYWCADHYMLQRIFGARSLNDARNGTFLAAFLKLFPMIIFVLPGLIAVALFPQIKGDEAYPQLIASGILPIGIKGLVVSGVLAAIMSSLAASFNSISAIYTIDFYRVKNPDSSDRTLVLVGRMTTIFVVVVVITLIPFVRLISSQLFIFLQSTQAYVSAPITAVLVLGFILKEINAKSAFASIIVGEMIGLSRFLLEVLNQYSVLSNNFLVSILQINYLHFTIFLFVGTASLLLILNYVVRYGENVTVKNYLNILEAGTGGSSTVKMNLLYSGLLLILTIGLWTVLM